MNDVLLPRPRDLQATDGLSEAEVAAITARNETLRDVYRTLATLRPGQSAAFLYDGALVYVGRVTPDER
jgi:hypothetical protein